MPSPVLIHGFTGSSAAWGEPIVRGLAAMGSDPVLLDLPGHGGLRGDVRRGDFTLESVLSAIRRKITRPVDLIGYSMGGRIALHFASAYPELVRRLVLESASPGLETEEERSARRRSDEDLAVRIEAQGIEWFVDYWEALPLFETRTRVEAETRRAQRRMKLAHDPSSIAAALRGLGTGALPSLWDRLQRIEVPTLLVVGQEDTKFVHIAKRMAASLRDARVVIVAGVGHTVHLEGPTTWLTEVRSFLTTESHDLGCPPE